MSQQSSQRSTNDLTINLNVITNNVAPSGSTKMTKTIPFQHPFLMTHTKYTNYGKVSSQNTNEFGSYSKPLPNLNKYQHWNSQQDISTAADIIQCPNPTANPLVNHQKQEQFAAIQKKQILDANYGKRMEQKVRQQNELIQSLMHQNNILSLQSTQQQNYIKMIQNQNNVLLTAYNAIQKQSKASLVLHKEDEYEKWNVSDVIAWISSLENGKFLKYSYSFCLNNIDGNGVKKMTLQDLEKMGVKNDVDKALILSHIKKLGNNDSFKTTEGQIDTKMKVNILSSRG